jgi:hypothetical protein
VKEIPIPILKPEEPKGGLDLEFDPNGNLWSQVMYQAGIARIDRKKTEVTVYLFPKEWQGLRRRRHWFRRRTWLSVRRCGSITKWITKRTDSASRQARTRILARPRPPAKTVEVTICLTPFSGSRPRWRRRTKPTSWFAEHGGNGIGMFDPQRRHQGIDAAGAMERPRSAARFGQQRETRSWNTCCRA